MHLRILAMIVGAIVPIFGAWRMVQITAFIVGIGAVASIYPALRATRIDGTEAMKFDR